MITQYGTILNPADRAVLRVASPVKFGDLDEPSACPLRLIVKGPLTPDDARRLSEYSRHFSSLTICIPNFGEPCGTDFLQYFPHLNAFELLAFDFDDFPGLEALPSTLTKLGLAQTKSKRHSLAFLRNFKDLRCLSVEAHTKDIEAISDLQSLEDLTLRSITLPNLAILEPLKNLCSLDIKLGGTKDLALLPRVGKLRYLELWMVKGLTDLNPIAEVVTLQNLFLQALKNVTALPSFEKLIHLRRVELDQMQGLTDLTPVSQAPALEELLIGGVRNLDTLHFEPLLHHPSLRAVNVGLGSAKKNAAVESYLGRASVEPTFEYRP